jgi:hypothetical protein
MKITRKQLREMADSKGYIARKGSKTPKLRITEDGTIYRADVELSIARKMTLSEAAKCLA